MKSHKRHFTEHEQKLEGYKKDPYAYDNKGYLKNAPNEITRQKIINGRIKELLEQINKQKYNYDEAKRALEYLETN